MAYTALPDRRIPYDNDGTVVYIGALTLGASIALSGAQMIGLNSMVRQTSISPGTGTRDLFVFVFFPEQREVSAFYALFEGVNTLQGITEIKGSNDTTNGLDGTWETASITVPPAWGELDDWRRFIKAISLTGPKRVIRIGGLEPGTPGFNLGVTELHLYGAKAAGQTVDDVIYLNGLNAFAEFTAPEDFGDQPLGTTVVRQFRIKNASPTKIATTINIQCNDADFAISTDNVTWVVTINIASLGPLASSATMYVRCTTPAPGAPLGPRFARIVTTVASYI